MPKPWRLVLPLLSALVLATPAFAGPAAPAGLTGDKASLYAERGRPIAASAGTRSIQALERSRWWSYQDDAGGHEHWVLTYHFDRRQHVTRRDRSLVRATGITAAHATPSHP